MSTLLEMHLGEREYQKLPSGILIAKHQIVLPESELFVCLDQDFFFLSVLAALQIACQCIALQRACSLVQIRYLRIMQ